MNVKYVTLGNVCIVSCSLELTQLLAKEISTTGLGYVTETGVNICPFKKSLM